MPPLRGLLLHRRVQPIKLKPYETARSLAIVPGAQHFVLGADFTVRLFDRLGHEVWPEPLPGPGVAFHVNVTGDGRLAVVAYGDGTIRWLRLSDGKEQLALFIHPDGKRWIAWSSRRLMWTKPSARPTPLPDARPQPPWPTAFPRS
jgi:hypothetical protein